MLECNDMRIKGTFTLSVYDDIETVEELLGIASGSILAHPFSTFSMGNVITLLGRRRAAELLGGSSTDSITQIAIGDSGASSGDPSIPLIPTVNDTDMGHEVTRASSGVNIPSGSQTVEFTAGFTTSSLSASDFLGGAGNERINEAGLFTSDNVLFARRTFPSIGFAPSDRVGTLIRWVIEVL